MTEYIGRPKQTEEFFDGEGFGLTPDLVKYDEDGKIYHICRLNDAMQ